MSNDAGLPLPEKPTLAPTPTPARGHWLSVPALRGATFNQQIHAHQPDEAQQLFTQARKQVTGGLAFCVLIGGMLASSLSGVPGLMWSLVLIGWSLSIFINLRASAYLSQTKPRTIAGAVLAFIPLLTLIGLAFEFRARRKAVFG